MRYARLVNQHTLSNFDKALVNSQHIVWIKHLPDQYPEVRCYLVRLSLPLYRASDEVAITEEEFDKLQKNMRLDRLVEKDE
mmetsp:Transcript_1499/g.5372  ORF Transcript_1499/g.5372 Transcript_1499/m.5372 type:complete len:81 (+) Transcript_1499:3-245(+)